MKILISTKKRLSAYSRRDLTTSIYDLRRYRVMAQAVKDQLQRCSKMESQLAIFGRGLSVIATYFQQ